MKAMALTGINKMELVNIPKPQISKPNEVLIKIDTMCVCGSDIHYYTTGRIGGQVVEYPFTVGHECSGIVESIGSAVERVKPNDRIAIEPAVSCGLCDQCNSGRPHTCRSLLFLGCPGQLPGCLCEYLIMPESCCYPIPDGLTLYEAAFSEPLAIGVYAAKQANLQPGATVGIFGAGPIGLCTLMAAINQNVTDVYITDKLEYRIDLAKQFGAKWGGNPITQNIVESISNLEPHLLDVVFECCGDQDALDQSLQLLKPGGKLLIVGIPEVDRVSFCIDELRRKEIHVINVRRQNHCVLSALDLIQSQRFKIDETATHIFPLKQAKEAFDLVSEYRDGVFKAVIKVT